VGQATLCFGGVFLSLLLFRTRLIPQVLAGLGVLGYMVHAAGSVSEMFGVPLSMYLLIPGALFEVGIALWLIVKGFQPAVVGSAIATSEGALPPEAPMPAAA
jgi:hypothetical protein